MYDIELRCLDEYVSEKYPEPKGHWTKKHISRAITARMTCEEVFRRCYENPMSDPRDVIFNYELELIHISRYIRVMDNVVRINRKIEVLEDLISILQ